MIVTILICAEESASGRMIKHSLTHEGRQMPKSVLQASADFLIDEVVREMEAVHGEAQAERA